MKSVFFVGLMVCLTSMLIDTARAVERMPSVHREDVPVDFEHVGSDPEYVHGAHCIDGRTF
jgi:hypothetical protein